MHFVIIVFHNISKLILHETICDNKVLSTVQSNVNCTSLLPPSLAEREGHFVDDINEGQDEESKQVTIHQSKIDGGIPS